MKYNKRVYFSVEELFKQLYLEYSDTTSYVFPLGILRDYINDLSETRESVSKAIYQADEFYSNTTTNSDTANALFNMLFDSYKNYYGIYKDIEILSTEEEETEITSTMELEFVSKIINVYMQTQDRYLNLLNIYSTQRANLLNKVKSLTSVKYNDTPQNSGDFTSEEFTSNYTISESESDVSPLIERIDEISRKYRNLLRERTDEFKGLFLVNGDE